MTYEISTAHPDALPGKWCVVELELKTGTEYHVLPLFDLRMHVGPTCWCGAAPDAESPDVIIHNSMDGREAYERGEVHMS